MRTAMTAMAPTPPMSNMRLPTNISLLPPTVAPIRAMKESKNTRDEEENDIHDPEGKTRLLHRALLVRAEMYPSYRRAAEIPKGDRVRRADGDVGAVLVGDVAQGVDAADEGAHEEEVDEGYEARVVGGAVVGEEGCDGPG